VKHAVTIFASVLILGLSAIGALFWLGAYAAAGAHAWAPFIFFATMGAATIWGAASLLAALIRHLRTAPKEES
jgi:hypothetical protein